MFNVSPKQTVRTCYFFHLISQNINNVIMYKSGIGLQKPLDAGRFRSVTPLENNGGGLCSALMITSKIKPSQGKYSSYRNAFEICFIPPMSSVK